MGPKGERHYMWMAEWLKNSKSSVDESYETIKKYKNLVTRMLKAWACYSE